MLDKTIDLRFEREKRRNGAAKKRKKAKPQYFAIYDYEGTTFAVKLFAYSKQDAIQRIEAMKKTIRHPVSETPLASRLSQC